ncbi:MAG: hypothetical protein V4541_06250 [Bacteroidota bacterium]
MQKSLPINRYLFVLCVLAGTFFSSNIHAQKRPVLTDEEQVQEAVSKEVDALFKSPDFLKKKNKKFSAVKGYIVVDMAVVQNGKLSSFFKVDSDIKDIDFIEYIADLVLKQKFEFKLPKQQRYKIRQTINIE